MIPPGPGSFPRENAPHFDPADSPPFSRIHPHSMTSTMNQDPNAADPPDDPETNPALERAENNPGITPHPAAGVTAPPARVIKVLVADDHPLVRAGIRQCINDSPGMEVVGEAGTALEVLKFLGRSKCDALVLDIGLPDQSGLEVMRILKKTHPKLPVLILTMYPEDQFAAFCMQAGAAKFLHKSNASHDLVAAIREVTRDGYRIRPAAGGMPAAAQYDDPRALPHLALSGREFHIFRHLASGKTRQAIATDLGITLKAVSGHRVHILKVMGMKTNAEIVAYARTHHLCS
jgi:DNA-binding NarL/FixJ family response regulator